ncbi:hypothetical protein [Nitrospira sp. Ecomares 2.1]
MKVMYRRLAMLEAGMDTKVVTPGAQKKRKSTPSQEPPTVRLTRTFISLEPRILFNGAKLVAGVEVVQDSITQEQPGIPYTEGERKKVDDINSAAEVIHLDSTRNGSFIAILDLDIKVGLLETQGIIIRAGFQKWQRLLTETTYIVYEPASSDMGDQAHEIHSTKPWGQPYPYDSPESIYTAARIGLIFSSTFPSGSS